MTKRSGNLTHVDNVDIQYAQSGVYTPADFSFPRDAIAGECSENTETVMMAEVDMETLRRYRDSKETLTMRDRRTDIYAVQIRAREAGSDTYIGAHNDLE